MKNLVLDIAKFFRATMLVSAVVLSCSCSNNEEDVPFKGATLPITQGIAQNVVVVTLVPWLGQTRRPQLFPRDFWAILFPPKA